MATSPVTLDFSKATPIQPVTLDFSKAVPISEAKPDALAPKGGWSLGDAARGAAAGIKNMVMHPIDTVAGMAEPFLASGVAPGGMYPTTAATGRPQDSQANAQVQQQAQQGQVQAADFIKKNPAYAAGGVIGPAAVTFGAAKLAPKILGAGVSGAGRAALLGKTPEGAYESALKPSTTLSQADRSGIVQTGLQNEIPISKAGLEKLGDRIDTLNDAIKNEIASDPTRPIDPNKVATRADLAKAKFANQVNASGDLNAIDASRQQFLQEQGATNGQPAPDMAAAKAQAMKQGTYRVLAGKYGEQGSASVEAQKALARGLKEEIATQFPEISKLNAAESKLLDLQPILERAVNRISNHQLIGIGTPVAGAAAKAVTGSSGIGAIAGVMKAVLDNPAVKSRLAIAVSKAQKMPFGQASAKVQAYSAALGATGGATQAYSSGDTPNQ